MTRAVNRRRFITIAAATAGLGTTIGAGFPVRSLAANASVPALVRWRGIALGAEASLTLAHSDPAAARAAMQDALAELARLEHIFSLFQPASAVRRLNAAGELAAPPMELVELLGTARTISEATDGAFDVTVQPLWDLLAAHYAGAGANAAGPSPQEISNALQRVDYRRIDIAPGRIAFGGKGMAITLNGIAQGYVTDRVSAVLRDHGFPDVIVNLGEIRANGHHPSGRDWQVRLPGIETPLGVRDRAVATSSGAGTPFGDGSLHHHLFDPHTGHSPQNISRLTVIAPTATLADGLSTAFFLMPEDARKRALARLGQPRVRILTSTG